jgi:hypothetical protein
MAIFPLAKATPRFTETGQRIISPGIVPVSIKIERRPSMLEGTKG